MIKNTRKSKSLTPKIETAKPESAKTVAAASTPKPFPVPAKPTPVLKEVPKPNALPVSATSAAPMPATPPPSVSLELVNPTAKRVCVAGSFNEWRPESAPLVAAGNGRWVGNLSVKPGRYEYLFVVDGQWLPDPNAKETVQNPFGGRNSVLTVAT